MRIPFDIKYRPQIESGEYKVVTRADEPVRIICWDKKNYKGQREPRAPIVYLLLSKGGCEHIMSCTLSGLYSDGLDRDSDLFIITPEPELSEFEKRIRFTIDEVVDGRYNADNIEDVKGVAKGLLALAREQIIKDGYVIEKKAFHDAVEKVAPEVMKEVSDKVDMEEALRLGYEKGRADALKDLPRWKTIKKDCNANVRIPHVGTNIVGEMMLYIGENAISISRLTKLPGFKEDE